MHETKTEKLLTLVIWVVEMYFLESFVYLYFLPYVYIVSVIWLQEKNT